MSLTILDGLNEWARERNAPLPWRTGWTGASQRLESFSPSACHREGGNRHFRTANSPDFGLGMSGRSDTAFRSAVLRECRVRSHRPAHTGLNWFPPKTCAVFSFWGPILAPDAPSSGHPSVEKRPKTSAGAGGRAGVGFLPGTRPAFPNGVEVMPSVVMQQRNRHFLRPQFACPYNNVLCHFFQANLYSKKVFSSDLYLTKESFMLTTCVFYEPPR